MVLRQVMPEQTRRLDETGKLASCSCPIQLHAMVSLLMVVSTPASQIK